MAIIAFILSARIMSSRLFTFISAPTRNIHQRAYFSFVVHSYKGCSARNRHPRICRIARKETGQQAACPCGERVFFAFLLCVTCWHPHHRRHDDGHGMAAAAIVINGENPASRLVRRGNCVTRPAGCWPASGAAPGLMKAATLRVEGAGASFCIAQAAWRWRDICVRKSISAWACALFYWRLAWRRASAINVK